MFRYVIYVSTNESFFLAFSFYCNRLFLQLHGLEARVILDLGLGGFFLR